MKTKANGEKYGYECFLSLADMEFNQDEETPFSFYTNYRSRQVIFLNGVNTKFSLEHPYHPPLF